MSPTRNDITLSTIAELLTQYPELSNRAIAKLAHASAMTVAKVRGPTLGQRYEANGRQARGVRPAIPPELQDNLPTAKNVLYRCYSSTTRGKAELLYIGISITALQRLAAHPAQPWYHEIRTITLTHYPSRRAALRAEVGAINREHPKYNLT